MSLSRLTADTANNHIDVVVQQERLVHRPVAADPQSADALAGGRDLLQDLRGAAIRRVVVCGLWRMQCKLQCSTCRMQYNDWKMKRALATDAV
jgi:hypothetical protein